MSNKRIKIALHFITFFLVIKCFIIILVFLIYKVLLNFEIINEHSNLRTVNFIVLLQKSERPSGLIKIRAL